jgi:hypothetical protein
MLKTLLPFVFASLLCLGFTACHGLRAGSGTSETQDAVKQLKVRRNLDSESVLVLAPQASELILWHGARGKTGGPPALGHRTATNPNGVAWSPITQEGLFVTWRSPEGDLWVGDINAETEKEVPLRLANPGIVEAYERFMFQPRLTGGVGFGDDDPALSADTIRMKPPALVFDAMRDDPDNFKPERAWVWVERVGTGYVCEEEEKDLSEAAYMSETDLLDGQTWSQGDSLILPPDEFTAGSPPNTRVVEDKPVCIYVILEEVDGDGQNANLRWVHYAIAERSVRGEREVEMERLTKLGQKPLGR